MSVAMSRRRQKVSGLEAGPEGLASVTGNYGLLPLPRSLEVPWDRPRLATAVATGSSFGSLAPTESTGPLQWVYVADRPLHYFVPLGQLGRAARVRHTLGAAHRLQVTPPRQFEPAG